MEIGKEKRTASCFRPLQICTRNGTCKKWPEAEFLAGIRELNYHDFEQNDRLDSVLNHLTIKILENGINRNFRFVGICRRNWLTTIDVRSLSIPAGLVRHIVLVLVIFILCAQLTPPLKTCATGFIYFLKHSRRASRVLAILLFCIFI